MRGKKWIIKEQRGEEVDTLRMALNISPTVARLLINRSYNTPEKARVFLSKTLDLLHDPFLLLDMDKATARIETARKNGEKVTIYGDYDVDGVTSVSILMSCLKKMGMECDYYIPDRNEEGFGINLAALKSIAEAGTTLVITVDTGITAIDEIKEAAEMGLDIIVTDHHECAGELPGCVAVINPKRPDSGYPFSDLAGVGVVFKLVTALMGTENLQQVIDEYSDLAAFGTIADVMPLLDENRTIVSVGLKRLENTSNVGLKALISLSGIENKKITAGTVGYALAPRVNAAGRIGCASRAVELLTVKTPEMAFEISRELCDANRVRQEEENRILSEAVEMAENDPGFRSDKIVVLGSDDWHHGVIGIVSSRISDRYYLPSVLVSFDGEVGKGSSRSIPGFNIYEAIERQSGLLEKFGGHALAAGLSIKRENFDEFKRLITEYANSVFDESLLVPKLEIDCEISPSDVSVKTANDILYLEPYGMGNPTPLFMIKNMRIDEITSISADKHLRLMFSRDGAQVRAFMFGCSADQFPCFLGETVDIVCTLDINHFRGEVFAQVIVKDIRLGERAVAEYECGRELYSRYAAGDELERDELCALIPNRDSFVAVYRAVKNGLITGDRMEAFRRIISTAPGLTYPKFRVALDVFSEMGMVLSIGDEGDVSALPTAGKVNLDDSPILIGLKQAKQKSG